MYNACNFGFACWQNPTDLGPLVNATVLNTRLNVFLCPSDGMAGTTNINSYHPCHGITTDPWQDNSTGVFAHNASYSIASVTDGTTDTIAFSEALVGPPSNQFLKWREGVTNVADPTGGAAIQLNPYASNAGYSVVNTLAQACQIAFLNSSTSLTNLANNKGWRWAMGSPGVSGFNTIVTPNSNLYTYSSCRTGCPGCGIDYGQIHNVTSNHAGGVNVLMTDGSVRFVKSSISQATWWALGTKDSGEAIDANSF